MDMFGATIGLVARARRAGRAAMLRGLAGTPGGVAAGSRRGTVLVLVIGALALISVITLIYATVGKADRRNSQVVVQKNSVGNTVGEIADYISGVIGDGAMAVYVDGVAGANINQPSLVRQAADIPHTDPFRLSLIPSNNLVERAFDATGSYSTLLSTSPDPRVPSTPFLASTVPTATAFSTAGSATYTQFKDWLHITTIAPDGRFVNLWNLRGNFDASSVMNVGGAGVGTPQPGELSYGLVLLDDSGNPTVNLPSGAAANPNRPADWSVNQRNAFRPLTGPNFYPGATNDPQGVSINSPGSSWYAPYQWVDTDGDGIADARWFELVDARDPDNPISLLPTDDRFRWFIAARVMDLSGLVNLNTATDFRSANLATAAFQGQGPLPANQYFRVGSYPSDLDLRRVLTGDDTYRQFGIGYEAIPQPIQPSLEDYSGYDQQIAGEVGSRAFDSLRIALRKDSAAVVERGTDLSGFMAAMNPALTTFYGEDRARYYIRYGGQASAGLFTVSGNNRAFEQSTRFGVADLLELLSFYGINNPGVTSRLEQTAEGRLDGANGGSVTTSAYGPFRGNRGLTVERAQIDDAENSGRGNGVLDDDAMALAITDIRRKVTPISWSRPIRSGLVPSAMVGALDETIDGRIDLVAALQAATVTTASQRNPGLLVEGIAQGLLPHIGKPGAWDPSAAPEFRTLHYGYRPELSVRIAAHLAANAIDAYDRDGQPTAFTALLDSARRSNIASNLIQFPWWSEPGVAFPGRFDLGDSRLGSTSSGGPIVSQSGAVNVYGIEAQPFVTQALSMVFYTDSPDNPTEPAGTEITIKGDVSPDASGGDNPDFLGAVLAFQITNPFDHEVNLSRASIGTTTNRQPIPPNNWTEYYIEYGGQLIMLAEWAVNESTGETTLTPIVLQPRETRVVYCTSHPLDSRYDTAGNGNLEARFRDASATLPPPPGYFIKDMLENQLTVRLGTSSTRPALVPLMKRGSAQGEFLPQPETSPTNLHASSDTVAKSNVYLWRNLHAQTEPLTNGTATVNDRSNDMLADRLRDPRSSSGSRPTPTLDRLLSTGDKLIEGTLVEDDDTGYSIVLWGSIRRLDDPGAATTIPVGAIPSYCVEAKWGGGNGFGSLQNRKNTEPPSLATLRKAMFSSTTQNGDDTLAGLVGKLRRGGGIMTDTEITRAPENRSGFPIGANLTNQAFASLYPQIALNNREFTGGTGAAQVSTMRVADILLPLGLGPSYDPPASGARPNRFLPPDPDRCLALSEALGLALNYAAPAPTDQVFGLYAAAGDPVNGVFDRGNLVLDRFTPFQDNNTNQIFDNGADETRYPGIPLALNLLNVFRTIDPQFGSVTKGTPGLVNINTMPTDVARAIPLLSPTTEEDQSAAQTVWDRWLTQAGHTPGVASMPMPPSSPGADDGNDVAAAIIAYRDKLQLPDRSMRNDRLVDFSESAGVDEPGRFRTTRIDGLREAPGFGSIAEIMAVTRRRTAATDPANPPEPRLPEKNRIDFLRGDNLPSGVPGVNSSLYYPTPYIATTNPPSKIDTIPDDYTEKLTIAAAAMNSVTVRSDVFAVWFVVHGYQRSDTEGLRAEDPLVPTVAKRYVMVVDRSNVTRKGQKPRILLFTEVPL